MTSPITVKLKRLPNGQGLSLPIRMTAQAAGFDICAAVDAATVIEPGQIKLVPCGFAMAIPHGYEAQVRPRSGLASKFGVTLVNSPGTIDSDYRGEVFVPLINHGRSAFTVERGTRIAQVLILPVPPIELVEVEELDETSRGAGGFGHTGH
jgi:dUTP pyrophosphatase